MKISYILTGMAVVLIALLGGIAFVLDSQLTGERARNAELQTKVESLEKDANALKQTPDYYFQRGVDMQYAGHLEEAKEAFETVVSQFPKSKLAANARQRLIFVNSSMAQNDATRSAHPAGGKGSN